jgi:hypothetical protein
MVAVTGAGEAVGRSRVAKDDNATATVQKPASAPLSEPSPTSEKQFIRRLASRRPLTLSKVSDVCTASDVLAERRKN